MIVEVAVRSRAGGRTRLVNCDGEPSGVDGIVVTPHYSRGEWDADHPVLTHEGSGWKIGGPYKSREWARQIAQGLDAISRWDSTEPPEQLRSRVLNRVKSDRNTEQWFWRNVVYAVNVVNGG